MLDLENQMPQAPKVSAQRNRVEGESGHTKGRVKDSSNALENF
jgi:hypothetical protein